MNPFANWTQADIDAQNRKASGLSVTFHVDEPFDACEIETGKTGLQRKIQDWCDSQWPKWVYDFPRTDMKSTLPLGRHDATIWGPYPTCILIETKAKGRKRSPDQLIWETRMKALGWTVFLVYSLDQFLSIVDKNQTQP